MKQNQDSIPEITPPIMPEETPILPHTPEVPEPFVPKENPPMHDPVAPPYQPSPEREPLRPGHPEVEPQTNPQ